MGQVPLNCQYVLLPCWSTGSNGSEPRPLVQVYNLKTVLICVCELEAHLSSDEGGSYYGQQMGRRLRVGDPLFLETTFVDLTNSNPEAHDPGARPAFTSLSKRAPARLLKATAPSMLGPAC